MRLDNARQRGAELVDGMNELKSAYPDMIKDVRGRGLLLAMELTTPEKAAAFVTKAKELGVTVSWTMNAGANVRISPPLVITAEQVSKGLDIFGTAFKKVK